MKKQVKEAMQNTEATQDDGPDTEEMEAEVDFISVKNIMAEDINDGLQYQVPKHHRCACHLLNLVSTVDANNANKTEAYKRLSRSVFSKSQALWNKISRSTTAAEVIEEHCKLQLVQPNATLWNSFYLAVIKIIRNQGEGAMRAGCATLNIPIARVSLRFCKPLVDALLDGLKKRFGKMMSDPELVAAAILQRKFKTSWTSDEDASVTSKDTSLTMSLQQPDSSSTSDEDDFFSSMDTQKKQQNNWMPT
ncbi:hypothetical protein N1851_012297 [Merluccius polli]|uniref:Transposase n=1 Tax=Merluccius polli TaxID=89951 RepID=A0AA47MXM6_MERPO|nr:hypothetical protein N1851_012297 [Merluccius polli]